MRLVATVSIATMAALGTSTVRAQQSDAADAAEIAKLQRASQNPVADMISIPFQLNSNFGVPPGNSTANVLNIQPVIPFNLTPNWNLISRTIIPVVWQPAGLQGAYYSGIGSTNVSLFLSPAKPGKLIWGAGLALNLPSSSPLLAPAGGSRNWSAGPTAVLLGMPGHFVLGMVASQTWSFAGPANSPAWSVFYSQVFINYNFEKGWYLTSAPIITADWTASGSNVWSVPLGGGFGRIMKLAGKLPINFNLSAYGYAAKPANGPDWTLRAQVALLLPKS